MPEIFIFVQVIVCFECGLEKTCTSEFFKDYQVQFEVFEKLTTHERMFFFELHEKLY